MSFTPSSKLVERVARGETTAAARLISRAEAGMEEAREAQAEIFRRAGRSHVIGVTGVPGSGKSTLVAKLTARLRKNGRRVAVVAIDPSSPYSGGAILGDRIRMGDVAGDPGVFVRSMATRGVVGGLARATLDAVDILDVAGFDTILIETVGVGQDEVEIAKASNTTIVVSAPGLGDDVQAIKAGMLEIADIHVVSKCDRSDAMRTLADLKHMLAIGVSAGSKPDWQTPVIGVSSVDDQGFDELIAALDAHLAATAHSEAGRTRRLALAEFRLLKTAEDLLLRRFSEAARTKYPEFTSRLARRESDPGTLANELLSASFPRNPS
jgi:LAO/AO transport system kinase